MESNNEHPDPLAELAKAVEALIKDVEALKRSVAALASRPDPNRPIGPRPGTRLFEDEYPVLPGHPFPSRPAPGKPYPDRFPFRAAVDQAIDKSQDETR